VVEKMSIGENIRRLRTDRNIKQVDLAEKIGVSQSMLAQIERGTKTVTMPLGKEIAEVFGCSVDDLISEITPKEM